MLALLVLNGLAASRAGAADSLTVRFEVGTATEVSNEQFYESSIDDTTFLGRRLFGTPETRVAAVARAEMALGSADGRWHLRLAPDASIGDKAVRVGTSASLRGRLGELTRLTLEPRVEYDRDEGFGMLRRDWRASFVGRLRRLSLDELGSLRVTAGSEVVRAAADSDPFVLSLTSARAALGYGRSPLFGWDWDVEYGAVARVFRDSTARDHVEHRLGAVLREDFEGGHSVALSIDADRRMALRDVPGSRDRFAQLHARVEPAFALGPNWGLRAELQTEIVRYDTPDSLIEFDYRLSGGRLWVRREFGTSWRVSTGPRAEWLEAPLSPTENYREVAWQADVERLTGTAWWNLAPAAGHRRYDPAPSAALATDLVARATRSSFDFLEVSGFFDQPVPWGVRFRALGTARVERHANPDHDARSLYFSVDVRRLF